MAQRLSSEEYNMQSRDFCYWLQGFFEVSGAKSTSEEQTKMIRDHLNLVFVHEIDPSMGDEKHQATLNKIHGSVLGTPPGQIIMRC